MLPFWLRFRGDLRAVAGLTSGERLLAIAERSGVPVSPEHCRHLDPQARIVVGVPGDE
jgi:hypothetical protein